MERQMSCQTEPEQEKCVGRVKWFNTKSGYGFITLLGEESADIFAHHTALDVSKEQYRYLVQGEYVEFDMKYANDSSAAHSRQATNIRGIQSGMLMCETIFENKQQQAQHHEASAAVDPTPAESVKPARPEASTAWTRVDSAKPDKRGGSSSGRGGGRGGAGAGAGAGGGGRGRGGRK